MSMQVKIDWSGVVGRFFLEAYVDKRDWLEMWIPYPDDHQVSGYKEMLAAWDVYTALARGRASDAEEQLAFRAYQDARKLWRANYAVAGKLARDERARAVLRKFSGTMGILSLCPFFNRLVFAFFFYLCLYKPARWFFNGLGSLMQMSAPAILALMKFSAKATLIGGTLALAYVFTMPTLNFVERSYTWVMGIGERYAVQMEHDADYEERLRLQKSEHAIREASLQQWRELHRLREEQTKIARAQEKLAWEIAHPEEVAAAQQRRDELKKANEAFARDLAKREWERDKRGLALLALFLGSFVALCFFIVFPLAYPSWAAHLYGIPIVLLFIVLEDREWGRYLLARLDERWQRHLVNRKASILARHHRWRRRQIRWEKRLRAFEEIVSVLWGRLMTAYHGSICPPVVARGPMPERYRQMLNE